MILRPNHTRCPACVRFVYATEGLYVAENWKGVEAIRGFGPGIYHDTCFRKSPYRDSYLAIARAVQNAELDGADQYLVVLGRTPRLALTLRPYTGDYQLRFLTPVQALRFRGPERWQEFLGRIVGPDGPQPTPSGDRSELRILRVREDWELGVRQTATITAEFRKPDFQNFREHLTIRGVNTARTSVELGALCKQLKIKPTAASCPLEHLIGTFEWPESESSEELVSVQLQVETWNTVELTAVEMDELRRFLLGIGKK